MTMSNQDKVQDAYDLSEVIGEAVSIGDIVLCDACNADHTIESTTGGFIFGSYAMCPACADNMMRTIKACKEEHYIKATCGPDETFAEFVRKYRGGDATVQIIRV